MLKLKDIFEVEENDMLLLESGDCMRAWAYETHCSFHSSKSDTRIKEVFRSVWRYKNE